MTGDLIDGQESQRIGLCLESVDEGAEAAYDKSLRLAERIASSGPLAVQSSTKSLRMKQDVGLEMALQREADAQAQTYASQDFKSGLEAVLAKNPNPTFVGA